MDLTLLPLAVTPVVLLVHVIWMVDRPRREPVRNVIRYVGAGALAGAVAIVLEMMLDPIDAQLGRSGLHWLARFGLVFVGVGLLEELCKFGWLALAARADAALDEPFDWIVYSVSVSLGFAALENIRVLWQGAAAGWTRAFFAVPLHALVGTLMGYHLARAMRDGPATAAKRRWLAVLEPALWHTAYDDLIFEMRAQPDTRAGLFTLFLVIVGALWVLAVRRTALLWRTEQALPPPILAPGRSLARLLGVRFGDGRGGKVEGGDPD